MDWLIDFAEACNRVLAPHGSLCVELGDTYSGSGNGPDALKPDGAGSHNLWLDSSVSKRSGVGWPLAKSLSLIPELFRLSLVYGHNPLTGRQTERWRLRNVVRWVRPNPPVGALGDKFRPATSELMVFCKSAKRYFDLDAVREPSIYADRFYTYGEGIKGASVGGRKDITGSRSPVNTGAHPNGAPPLDWWNIPPGGYEGSHYAVFPPELCIKPIKAMCPEKVCRVCGEPSRRISENSYTFRGEAFESPKSWDGERLTQNAIGIRKGDILTHTATLGFTDCGHDDWRPGVVLDPFGGSGTTALVATGHGRDCILIDLDERNYELALQRVGPFILELGVL